MSITEIKYSALGKKEEFLQNIKLAREERAFEKRRENCATLIQARVKGWLARIKYRTIILYVFFIAQLVISYRALLEMI